MLDSRGSTPDHHDRPQAGKETAMSKYEIGQPDINGLVWIKDVENEKAFNGYDFMGSVMWVDCCDGDFWCEPEEAEQIVRDLEAADEPDDEETEENIMKKYTLVTEMNGIREVSSKTGSEIVNLYMCHFMLGGLYSKFAAYDVVDGELKKISLYDIPEMYDAPDFSVFGDDEDDSI